MIYIDNPAECCGCGLCASSCSQNCIMMSSDEEGFLYPSVQSEHCIHCGKCEKVCPVRNKEKTQRQSLKKAYAAFHRDKKIRFQSSSGGIFSAIAQEVIRQGGVVFGAAFNNAFEVEHIYVERVEDLSKLRGSKYVQSAMGETYKNVLNFLKSGRLVLFSGTPCQVSALKLFLNEKYENLITVDVICHGVPSPDVWKKYVNYRKRKDSRAELKEVYFRDKSGGGVT